MLVLLHKLVQLEQRRDGGGDGANDGNRGRVGVQCAQKAANHCAQEETRRSENCATAIKTTPGENLHRARTRRAYSGNQRQRKKGCRSRLRSQQRTRLRQAGPAHGHITHHTQDQVDGKRGGHTQIHRYPRTLGAHSPLRCSVGPPTAPPAHPTCRGPSLSPLLSWHTHIYTFCQRILWNRTMRQHDIRLIAHMQQAKRGREEDTRGHTGCTLLSLSLRFSRANCGHECILMRQHASSVYTNHAGA